MATSAMNVTFVNVSAANTESFLNVLKKSYAVEESPTREPLSLATVVVVFKLISATATTAASISKLVREIMAWRNAALTTNASATCVLRVPKKGDLDVASASEEQMIRWFEGTM